MLTKKAHVVLPDTLLLEIDSLVGKRKRGAFLIEVASKEVKRLKLLKLLSDDKTLWKIEDHPELKNGSDKWVRAIRKASNQRLKKNYGTR